MVGPLLCMNLYVIKRFKAGVFFSFPPQWIVQIQFDLMDYKRCPELDTLFSGIKNTVLFSLSLFRSPSLETVTSSPCFLFICKLRYVAFQGCFFLLLFSSKALMIPYPAVIIPQFMMFSKLVVWFDYIVAIDPLPGIFWNLYL